MRAKVATSTSCKGRSGRMAGIAGFTVWKKCLMHAGSCRCDTSGACAAVVWSVQASLAGGAGSRRLPQASTHVCRCGFMVSTRRNRSVGGPGSTFPCSSLFFLPFFYPGRQHPPAEGRAAGWKRCGPASPATTPASTPLDRAAGERAHPWPHRSAGSGHKSHKLQDRLEASAGHTRLRRFTLTPMNDATSSP
jgi:hypothetical protein